MPTQNYGQKYWGIRVSRDVSSDGEIFLMADDARVLPDGSLAFIQIKGKKESFNLVVPHGKWTSFYAASMLDGSPVAIEHWDTEFGNKNHNSERDKMTQAIRYNVMQRDGFTCKKCGKGNGDGVKLEVDHIIPISKGGKTMMDNLETLCHDCNRGKRDK